MLKVQVVPLTTPIVSLEAAAAAQGRCILLVSWRKEPGLASYKWKRSTLK